MTKSKLDPKQMAALSLLLKGKSQTATAKEVGVSRQSIGHWMKDKAFAAKLNSMQKKKIEKIIDEIADLENISLEVVRSILENPDAKDSDRLGAAKIIQREAQRITYFQNLMVRMEAIEDWMENWKSYEGADFDWKSLETQFNLGLKDLRDQVLKFTKKDPE